MPEFFGEEVYIFYLFAGRRKINGDSQKKCGAEITVISQKKLAEWEKAPGCLEKFWRLAIANNPRIFRRKTAGLFTQ